MKLHRLKTLKIIATLCILVYSHTWVYANPLLLKGSTSNENKAYSIEELQFLIDEQSSKESTYEQDVLSFDSQLQKIQQEINESKEPLNPKKEGYETQINASYEELERLNQRSIDFENQKFLLKERAEKTLPYEIREVQESLKKHLNLQINPDSNDYLLRTKEREYLKQLLATLKSEQDSHNERLHILMIRQELNTLKRKQLQEFITLLNQKKQEERNENTKQVIDDLMISINPKNTQIMFQVVQENRELSLDLKNITQIINSIIDRQQEAERSYEEINESLQAIDEQITWMESNAVFGESLLQSLQGLPPTPRMSSLQKELTALQVTKYGYLQRKNSLIQKIDLNEFQSDIMPFLETRIKLLNKLVESYKTAENEMARLQVKTEMIVQVDMQLRKKIGEHLFWIRNTSKINLSWFKSLASSIHWFIHNQHWAELNFKGKHEVLWSLWLIYVFLCIAIYDLLKKPYLKVLSRPSFKMNFIQKNYMFHIQQIFFISILYGLIFPSILIFAGLLTMKSTVPFTKSIGDALFINGIFIAIYSVFSQLSRSQGIFIHHFNLDRDFIGSVKKSFFKFTFFCIPFITLVVFCESYDSTLLKNNLGRGSFIILCTLSLALYYEIYTHRRSITHKNLKNGLFTLEKIILSLIASSPIICIFLSVKGYCYTGFQIMKQLHLSLLIGSFFLILYLFFQHWMVIQRKRIAYDIAKKKREEYLSKQKQEQEQKQKQGQQTSQDSLRDEIMQLQGEKQTDLDEISKHTLQLLRSLLTLSFAIAVIALWSQTQSTSLYFLDEIAIWSTTSVIDGIQQSDSVTLKSALVFILIIGISTLLVKNLPSLLELIILQRTTLSPANKFAITTMTRYLLIILGIIIAFYYLGISWSKLQWLLAALTLGLGFGLQEIFGNFFSGLMILFEKPIRIGDTVTIRELTGTISKINIRATTIIDWDRKEIIIPNKAFITEQLVNWSLSDSITRVTTTVSVARDSDSSLVETLLHQAIKDCEYALENPEPEIWFAGFGSHTQDYEIRAFVKQMNYRWPLRHQLHNNIFKKFKENNVIIAYPQLELFLHNSLPEGDIPKNPLQNPK